MKHIRIFCFSLLALCCIGTMAAGKKKTKKDKKAPVEVVDTVSVDTFSYACGKANTQGLKNYLVQRLGMDTTYMDDFMKGFDQILLTEADKKAKARLAGIEIRTQLETQILPNVNKQISDSADIIVKEKFIQGFNDGLMGANMHISMDSTQKIVSKQAAYYQKVKTEKLYGANRAAGEEFLKLNAKKDSVKTTPSGLQYKEIKTGTGEKPQPTHKVTVHYEGRMDRSPHHDARRKQVGAVHSPGTGLRSTRTDQDSSLLYPHFHSGITWNRETINLHTTQEHPLKAPKQAFKGCSVFL